MTICLCSLNVLAHLGEGKTRRIFCHRRNYWQPYFFKRNQSSDTGSHGFGAKFLFQKLSTSGFNCEGKSALRVYL